MFSFFPLEPSLSSYIFRPAKSFVKEEEAPANTHAAFGQGRFGGSAIVCEIRTMGLLSETPSAELAVESEILAEL
jgi:hypothetical protein